MTQPRIRRFTRSVFQYGVSRSARRGSWAVSALRACALAALLAALASVGTRGQAAPTFSVNDVIVNEGQSGLTLLEFTVSLANPNGTESSVGFTTDNGTATGGQVDRPFPSTGPIALADGPSSPYGVPIVVSGLTGPLVSMQLFLDGLTHPSPRDLDILLRSPGGQSMVVQSDAGPAANPTTVSYILRDYAPLLLDSFLDVTYAATSRSPADVFPAPAPSGPYTEGPPEGTASLSDAFHGVDPTGTWLAFIVDDSPGGSGTLNRIVLSVTTPEPGTDFTHVFGRLTFPPGTTERRVRVWANGDEITEADETFAMDLALPVNGVIGRGRGTGTIRNDDGGGSPPRAADDFYETPRDTVLRVAAPGILANDNANGGGPLTAQLVTPSSHGTVVLDADGSFTFTPNPGFAGEAVFTYRAANANGTSIATVRIEVLSGPAPPTGLQVINIRSNPSANSSQVTVRFNPPPPPTAPTNYEIAGGLLPGQTLATLFTDDAFPILRFDAPFGSFSLRAHPYEGGDRSIASNEVPLHVNTTVAPSAPANLLGLVHGANLDLAWKNTFRGGVPTNTYLQVSGSLSLTVPLGVAETFSYPAVPPGTYTFSVVNANEGGAGLPSDSVTLTFPGACGGPPQPPANFLLYWRGTSLGAIWDLPPDGVAPTSFALNVTSPVFTGRLPIGTREVQAQVPPGSYTASVEAVNACGASPPTPAQTVVVP